MRSPFPGMDPYLESRWADVHSTLVPFIKEAIQPLLPAGLRARSEQDVLLESDDGRGRLRPDVTMIETRATRPTTAGGATAVAEPVIVQFFAETTGDKRVEIIDATAGHRVITVIEVLSPANKGPGRANDEYRRKLSAYRAAGVSVVEIDLLREPGRGRLEYDTVDIPAARQAAYYAGVRRGWAPDRWEVYPLPLRERLAPFPVPLREMDSDIVVDLQPLIDRVYTAGGHDDIDYTRPASPALSDDDAVWAAGLVAGAR